MKVKRISGAQYTARHGLPMPFGQLLNQSAVLHAAAWILNDTPNCTAEDLREILTAQCARLLGEMITEKKKNGRKRK